MALIESDTENPYTLVSWETRPRRVVLHILVPLMRAGDKNVNVTLQPINPRKSLFCKTFNALLQIFRLEYKKKFTHI